ncbi:hypothetical protein [Paraburkholderia sp. J8-2]|uniref:hypothetical protein n=1 Tax=Paraburkholderia sp. J8-2 TaxID=2805440 RepID=UPI002AB63C0E|nr:hypothetical protein [Paraburkholderia sp. J8-2]
MSSIENADVYPCRGSAGGTRAARESALVMAAVDVVFYKEILDHRGFAHRCALMRVPNAAADVDEAIAGAILEFEKARRVNDWTIVADGYEVQTQHATV